MKSLYQELQGFKNVLASINKRSFKKVDILFDIAAIQKLRESVVILQQDVNYLMARQIAFAPSVAQNSLVVAQNLDKNFSIVLAPPTVYAAEILDWQIHSRLVVASPTQVGVHFMVSRPDQGAMSMFGSTTNLQLYISRKLLAVDNLLATLNKQLQLH